MLAECPECADQERNSNSELRSNASCKIYLSIALIAGIRRICKML
ncbi:hypothetical protein HMPREF1990_00547 [Porphyromonas gingivalis W4087]|nr:hypothetical protein HMPREF1554_01394 [Porphyromonas gingivalis F0569]ERJ90652.1 hypothetical protein HMPREF1990_00547 [Porphyromonas gingivalis W4087]